MSLPTYSQAIDGGTSKKQLVTLAKFLNFPEGEPVYIRTKEWGAQGWYWKAEEKRQYLGANLEEAILQLQTVADPKEEIVQSYNIPTVTYDMLNGDQKEFFDIVKSRLDTKQGGTIVLRGFAGTGKTTVIQAIAQELSSLYNMAFTAPTNKAVKVLRSKIHGLCVTIHSLLNLKVKKERGTVRLVQTKPPKLSQFNLLVIDECSMIGQELRAMIKRSTSYLDNILIIFVGDPKQLNPVNEEQSQTFEDGPVFDLTKIVRQAEGHPILDNTKRLRRMRKVDPKKLKYGQREGLSFVRLSPSDWTYEMEEMFMSDGFKDDNDYCRVICWTNEMVDKINKRIHGLIYGNTDTPYVVGERIIVKEPVAEGSIKTDSECIVRAIEPGESYGFKCWNMIIESCGIIAPIEVIQDDYKTSYQEQMQEYANNRDWDSFYVLDENFSDIQHVYAMTAHRSQGSTFRTAFVHLGDMIRNPNFIEAVSMVYVAVSRATTHVYIRL